LALSTISPWKLGWFCKGFRADFLKDASIVSHWSFTCDIVLNYEKAFLSALLKDIRSERPKITEKDNLRLLFLTKWFLEFFLAMQSKEHKANVGQDNWNFGLVAEVTERSWIIWVLKRMREAVEEKVRCQLFQLL
jgi:hypothetical protein